MQGERSKEAGTSGGRRKEAGTSAGRKEKRGRLLKQKKLLRERISLPGVG